VVKKVIWSVIVVLTLVFVILYIYNVITPSPIDGGAYKYFSNKELKAAQTYQTINRLLYITAFSIKILVLAWLLAGSHADKLQRWSVNLTNRSYLLSILVFFLAMWVILRAVSLPFSLYGGYFLQHQWGFSTQALSGWWSDYIKGAGLDLVLSGLGVILLFWAMKKWPNGWWLAAALFVSIWIVIQSYLWPVLVSPLFNKFEPVKNPEIIKSVEGLAEKAGIPVKEILIMDASIRTKKSNAYFAGLGGSKRIVLYDNLVNRHSLDVVEAVVAHEIAHWKHGHIIKGITYGVIGNVILWLLLFNILSGYKIPEGGYMPKAWVTMLMFFLLVSFVTSPLQNIVSRKMEYQADSTAVQLTRNPEASVDLLVNLAKDNLSDVSPPAYIEWFSYSHPSIMHRIRNITH